MATTLGDVSIKVKLEIPGMGGTPGAPLGPSAPGGTVPGPVVVPGAPGSPGAPGAPGADGRDGGEGRFAPGRRRKDRDDVPGGDDDEPDPGVELGKASWRGLKSAYGGGLYGDVVAAIPFAGVAVAAAKYGPAVGTAIQEAIPGDTPAAQAARALVESGIAAARTLTNALNDAKAFLNATGAGLQGAQSFAVLQSQLTGGVNLGQVADFGVLSFKVREYFERLDMAREQRDKELLGGAMRDTIRAMTPGASGR